MSAKNVEMKVTKNVLTIKIDLNREFGPSKSGKTTIVASSGGNVLVPGAKEDIKIGINCYK